MSSKGWIGVDLDGTLAHYDGYKGPEHIGPAIPKMLERVKKWIIDGRKVKIFTARANDGISIPYIEIWLEQNGIPGLEITATKDYSMFELWDDRCVQVEKNTGEVADEQNSDMIQKEFEEALKSAERKMRDKQTEDFVSNAHLDEAPPALRQMAEDDIKDSIEFRNHLLGLKG